MADQEYIRQLAYSFLRVKEVSHRKGITAFKTGGRIFATLNPAQRRCCLRLSEADQSVFSLIDPQLIHPVPKAWGRYGWTLFYYEHLDPEVVQDALHCAFRNMAPAKWVRMMEEGGTQSWPLVETSG